MSKLQDYLNINSKKYLVFDFDETVARIDIDWSGLKQFLTDLYKQYDSEFQNPNGYKLIDFTNEFVKKYGDEISNKIIEIEQKFEATNIKGIIPNPEIVDFIKNSNKYKMYIFSNNSKLLLEKSLNELGLLNKFEYIVSRESVEYIKPDSNGFKYMKDINTQKENFLMIGDSDSDKKAAENVGIDFFQVDYFKNK